ncbi:hypothetical protein JL720_343 [Aureococcus anophagefferens]|nr:hypothetical protein JL720_343 [Aureococcus anophagefferens]
MPQLRLVAGELGDRVHRLFADALADELLACLTSAERGRCCAAVNRRWADASRRLAAVEAAAIWLEPDMAAARTRIFENTRRREEGCGARVEEEDWSSAASVGAFLKHLAAKNVSMNTLVIAPEAERRKWATALEQIPGEVRSVFDEAELDRVEAAARRRDRRRDVRIYVLSYGAAENWEFITGVENWRHVILDQSADADEDWPWFPGGYGDGEVFFLHAQDHYVLYRPGAVTTAAAAAFHLCFVLLKMEVPVGLDRNFYDDTAQNRSWFALLRAIERGDAFTREVLRRELTSILDASVCSAAPGYRLGRARATPDTGVAAEVRRRVDDVPPNLRGGLRGLAID